MALGAFAVHQLRYFAAGAAEPPGHAYLGVVLPFLVLFAASSALGATAVVLLTGSTARRSAGWAFCTAALVLIFGVQETAEGLAPFGHGGWIAVPIAIVVGRIMSLLLAMFESVERRLASARTMPRAPAVLGRPRRGHARPLACSPLAFGLARRPPPPTAG